jgi:hypothetical protein
MHVEKRPQLHKILYLLTYDILCHHGGISNDTSYEISSQVIPSQLTFHAFKCQPSKDNAWYIPTASKHSCDKLSSRMTENWMRNENNHNIVKTTLYC